MIIRRLSVGLVAAAWLAAARAGAEESNFWPALVSQTDAAGTVQSWTAAGPLIFSEPVPSGGRVAGFRPFYVRRTNPNGELVETTVLYPIFYYRTYGDTYEWSVFKLINRYGRRAGGPATTEEESHTFDIWPFYFSRRTGDPATSTYAVFPIAGTIQGHLLYERLSWVLFPLYVRSENRGAVTTSTPWPFVRVTRGSSTGFALWPLFGSMDHPGVYHRTFFLWPLGWNNTIQPGPDAAAGTPPTRQLGILPFYTRERGPDLVTENYLWPFFGYSDRTAPTHYHETRYFWPFLVQGRGDDHYTNRWGPFYTHSVIKGMEKTWEPWPLVRRARWTDGGILQDKTQVGFFLYYKLEQHSATNPAAAPAKKMHLWPLLSLWDNGAGRRQLQVLSPLEVFFTQNEEVRESWTPFFAIWRYDQKAPGDMRASLLWNAVTWEKRPAEQRFSFHLGPLLGIENGPDGRRVSVGSGLLGWQRDPDGAGHMFWLVFRRNSNTTNTESKVR